MISCRKNFLHLTKTIVPFLFLVACTHSPLAQDTQPGALAIPVMEQKVKNNLFATLKMRQLSISINGSD